MRAGGGLAYREGRFYLTTANNELAEIDIDNPANSTILASFPPEIPLIRALFTYPYRCDSIITYAIGADSSESILYRLDFEDYSLTELCPLERFHLSASTANECVLPPCEIYADLDKDDSSGVPDTGYRRVTCAGPVSVSAPDVEVFSPFPLDSIRLQLTGILDAGNATLFADAQGGTAPYTFSWNSGQQGDTLAGVGAGTYQLLATDARGCTASAALALAGADTVLTTQDIQLCQGEAFEWQGGAYFSDTTLCQVYTSASGCDSTHCLSLLFLAPEYSEFQQPACRGEQLAWEGLMLEPYADTTVCVTYTAVTGCDSTLCLQVEVLSKEGTLEAAICQGETYPFNGQLLSEPGLYQDTLLSPDGCDSLLTLRLEAYPLPEPVILASGSLCTETMVQLSSSLEGEYLWSTGAAGRSITVSQAGAYSLAFTDARGCSADAVISLAENNLQAGFALQHPRCPGESSGRVVIGSITGGVGPYFIGLGEGALQAASSIEGLPGGNYTLIVEDAEGCRKQYGFSLQEPDPLLLSLPEDTTLKLGDSLLLRPSVNADGWSILWHPPDFLSCDTCLAPTARPLQTTTYRALLTDSLGCTAEAAITVFVRQQSGIYVPNAFSPNGDGSNDRLAPYADASIVEVEAFRIYNRWGALLFERSAFLPNDESLGWDGRAGGQPAPPGTYVYQLIARRTDGRAVRLEGEVSLMR